LLIVIPTPGRSVKRYPNSCKGILGSLKIGDEHIQLLINRDSPFLICYEFETLKWGLINVISFIDYFTG